MKPLALIWHLSPLLTLSTQRWPLVAAHFGLIFLCYVKVWKLSAQNRSAPSEDNAVLIRRWRALTFL